MTDKGLRILRMGSGVVVGSSFLLVAMFGYAIVDWRHGTPMPIPLRVLCLAAGAALFTGVGYRAADP